MPKKIAPNEWKVDEPYSPPYALPNTKPTITPPWRVDEQYTPAKPITRVGQRKIAPYDIRPNNVYTPTETFYQNTRVSTPIRRKRRLV